MINQRSNEWLELIKFYCCGNSTGIIPFTQGNYVKHYYNLIRGCIIELFIIHNLDFTSLLNVPVKKITVGLIVEKKGIKNSHGCAPDLLLITQEQEIIPVEIKSLIGKPLKNADY